MKNIFILNIIKILIIIIIIIKSLFFELIINKYKLTLNIKFYKNI